MGAYPGYYGIANVAGTNYCVTRSIRAKYKIVAKSEKIDAGMGGSEIIFSYYFGARVRRFKYALGVNIILLF